MSGFRTLARIALLAPVALLSTAGTLTLGSGRAEAQFFGFFDPPPPPRVERRQRSERPVRRERSVVRESRDDKANSDNDKAEVIGEPMLYAVVSLADQHIKVYGASGQIARSRVSTGQEGFETPPGFYGILEKHREHESNIYEGAEMPFMQRLTWSGIALHQGVVPRYPASHGCIRLPAAFAAKLWDMTKPGARVIVASHDINPVEITHARLPMARMLTADALGLQADAGASDDKARVVQVATADDSAVVPTQRRRYNPVEAAAAMKANAQAEVAASKKQAEKGLADARAAAAEANDAAAVVRDAKADLDAARANNAPAETIADIERRLAEAKALDAVRGPRALQAALAVRDAERAAEAARDVISSVSRRTAPLSVLISTKEGLVMVKQGTRPVYEAPFTLRDPGVPLGTHMFIATAPVGDDGQLRWSALTVANETAEPPKPKRGEEPAQVPPGERRRTSSASEALDRLTLTPETEQKLAELVWVGAHIIVTDRGVSQDFGEHTDMVIALP